MSDKTILELFEGLPRKQVKELSTRIVESAVRHRAELDRELQAEAQAKDGQKSNKQQSDKRG